MTGTLLIFIVFFWFVVATLITAWSAKKFKSYFSRTAISIILFPALLLSPLADELIAAKQFDSLCAKYAVLQIDEQHAMNRSVVYVRRGADKYAEGTAVPIRIDPTVFRDAETNQILVSYHTLEASSGWLIKALGISETNSPLLFKEGCTPKDMNTFKKKLNITVIN